MEFIPYGPVMNPENPLVPLSVRQDFARVSGGNDRARTATFINTNLDDLGSAEWMEAYSVNGSDWTLKRMVLQPNEAGGVIHQHTQKQHAPMKFISMLQHLAEYEDAQAALGYVLDGDDRGQATGTPLFRDVAKAEGIPHDANGCLVFPQKGHIIEDGAYPVEAFAVASAGHAKNLAQLASLDTSLILRQQDENGTYELSPETKHDLRCYAQYARQGLELVRGMNLKGLLNHRYRYFRFEFEYDRAMSNWTGSVSHYKLSMAGHAFNGIGVSSRDLPPKLLAYLRYQLIAADVTLRGVMVTAMFNQQRDIFLSRTFFDPRVERKLNTTCDDWKSAQHEFEILFLRDGNKKFSQLREQCLSTPLTSDFESAFRAVEQYIKVIDDTVSCLSVDLSALPDLPLLKRNELPLSLVSSVSRALNTGPR